MEVNEGSRRPTCITSSDLASTQSDPKCIIQKKMTEHLSYETAMPHKSARIDVYISPSVHNEFIAETAFQNAQES